MNETELQHYMWTAIGMRAVAHQPFGVRQYVRADDVEKLVDRLNALELQLVKGKDLLR